MASKKDLPAPVSGDVEDAVIARLTQAELLIAEAEPELARDIRDQAEAAMLLARRRRAGRLELAAGRLRLLAESRLGSLCVALNPGANFHQVDGVSPGKIEVEKVEPDKDLRVQYRRVHEARSFLDQYLDECRKDEETPTRRGFLDYAEATLRAIKAGKPPLDEEEEPEEKPKPAQPRGPKRLKEEVDENDEAKPEPATPELVAEKATKLHGLLEEAEMIAHEEVTRLLPAQNDLWARFLRGTLPKIERLSRDAYDVKKHTAEVLAGGRAKGVGVSGRARTPDEKANDPLERLRRPG